mmetsp:Transcript_19519/g.28375  ORF Transcript_19519/g.28375 Transcript_19519/m.28375 type:complete len:195 (+) Transcript_19519:38-622(+)
MKNISKNASCILLQIATATSVFASVSSSSFSTIAIAAFTTPTTIPPLHALQQRQQQYEKSIQQSNKQHMLLNPYSTSACATMMMMASPKRGKVVDSYQTVSVNCSKCRTRLFRYKKKNGTKSNLVKCYVERISEDSANLLSKREEMKKSGGKEEEEGGEEWHCPNCQTKFARSSLIHGRPALKLVGGKVQMTKK